MSGNTVSRALPDLGLPVWSGGTPADAGAPSAAG